MAESLTGQRSVTGRPSKPIVERDQLCQSLNTRLSRLRRRQRCLPPTLNSTQTAMARTISNQSEMPPVIDNTIATIMPTKAIDSTIASPLV